MTFIALGGKGFKRQNLCQSLLQINPMNYRITALKPNKDVFIKMHPLSCFMDYPVKVL